MRIEINKAVKHYSDIFRVMNEMEDAIQNITLEQLAQGVRIKIEINNETVKKSKSIH